MFWRIIIIAAIVASAVLLSGENEKQDQQRKSDLEEFEATKAADDDGECPCRPGGCCK